MAGYSPADETLTLEDGLAILDSAVQYLDAAGEWNRDYVLRVIFFTAWNAVYRDIRDRDRSAASDH